MRGDRDGGRTSVEGVDVQSWVDRHGNAAGAASGGGEDDDGRAVLSRRVCSTEYMQPWQQGMR